MPKPSPAQVKAARKRLREMSTVDASHPDFYEQPMPALIEVFDGPKILTVREVLTPDEAERVHFELKREYPDNKQRIVVRRL